MQKKFQALTLAVIYVFRIPYATHEGCLKIGMTSLPKDSGLDAYALKPNAAALNAAAKGRITHMLRTAGIDFELLHTELAVYVKDGQIVHFEDHEVHEVLRRSGVKQKQFNRGKSYGREWFVTDLATAKKAIAAVKDGKKSLSAADVTTGDSPIVFRPNQVEAINQTIERLGEGNDMLWNAKMRFGKTLCALEVVKRMQFQRTLIFTHRTEVDKQWFEDHGKIFRDTQDYAYGSKKKGESLENLEAGAVKHGNHYIYFATIQDLRGSEKVGGKYDKNKDIYSTKWDLLIVDEAHEGTQTELGQAVIRELKKRKTKMLYLSGTAYNLLDGFSEDEIYTWDYVKEQQAKLNWDKEHFGDHNPYASLPTMNIYTYNLGELYHAFADGEYSFKFKEFFRTDNDGGFVHEQDVVSFLNLLTKKDENSHYPYSTEEFRAIFRHTLWMLPGVKEAKALSKLLKRHPVFQNFTIVNVAGDGDEEMQRDKALNMVENAIGDHPEDTYTITLSCGRLTAGVSVPAWCGVLLLTGGSSASAYMQTIFRVQTPASIGGCMKENCYAFDFAPDRTLQVISSLPAKSNRKKKSQSEHEHELGELLNFCPVISISGSRMQQLDFKQVMQQMKKIYIERAVRSGFEDPCIYNQDLNYLSDEDKKMFASLLKIVGQTKAITKPGEIDINRQGLNKEDRERKEKIERKKKKDRTPEEEALLAELREKQKLRENAISILRGISIRMPLLIYGAEIQDENREITIDNFTSLVDNYSWEVFMPAGVTKAMFQDFKKFYEKSIFAGAGKKIRALVRQADQMDIEERIQHIAEIFSHFRNPDKETVLTPWRVVNLHMGDTLGGFNFFDAEYKDTIAEPRHIDNGAITQEAFSSTSRLLEINSKTGLYPLYLAYSMYRAKLAECKTPPKTREGRLKIWDDVVQNHVYVICMSQMAKGITKRTLVGFRDVKVNTKHFDKLIHRATHKQKQLASQILNAKSTWKIQTSPNTMKFNAIVGNPPYQLVVAQKETKNGQKRSSSIFHHFQLLSEDLGRYTSLIYPGTRWIHRSGKGLEKFGKEQINDKHLALLEFFPNADEIFQEVGIADGMSIVLKDMQKSDPGFQYVYCISGTRTEVEAQNPGEPLFHLNPKDSEIVDCLTQAITDHACLHDSVLSQKLFSIESDFVEKNPDKVREYNDGDIFDPAKEIKLFANDKAGKSGRSRWYITSRDVITTGKEELGKWKVVVSSANAGGKKRDNQIAILDNHSAFGRSRVALKTFKTKKEAENFYKYATSEIIRFAFLLTDEALTSLAKMVPDLENYRSDNGLIDYSGDVDAQLYALFGITEENIQHIKAALAAHRPEKN